MILPFHVQPSISCRYDGKGTFYNHWQIQWGGGGLRGLKPPLNFQKNSGHPRGRCDRFTRVTVVIDLVVTSSNNACLCALNGGPF